MTEIGTVIQRARHRKRMTQQQLADALGVSRDTVSSWESGRNYPLRNVGAIEELLEISVPAQDGERAS